MYICMYVMCNNRSLGEGKNNNKVKIIRHYYKEAAGTHRIDV